MTKIKIGILTGCFFMASHIAISPAIADISAQFPNVRISIVQMIITLPMLMAVPFSLLAGKLTSLFTKKTITMLSIGSILFGGCIPLIFNSSIIPLLIASCFIGGGIGGMITISAALICEYFHGEARSSLMGIQAACVNTGGMIFSVLGGQLSSVSWKYLYYSYLLALPAMFLVMLLLPKGKIEVKPDKAGNKNIGTNVFYLATIGFLFAVFINTFNTNISLYVTEQKFGGSVQASIATALCTFGGIVSGITLKKAMTIFNRYIISLSLVVCALGLGVTFIGSNLLVVSIGGLMVGIAGGIFAPAGSFIISQYLTSQNLAMGIAVFFSFCNFGNSLSPVVINGLSETVGGGVKAKFLISSIAMILIFTVTIIKIRFESKNNKLKYKTNSY